MEKKSSSFLIFLLASSLILQLSISLILSAPPSIAMATEGVEKSVGDGESAAVHIVYVDRPEGEDPEAFHIRTLAPVVGSEEAAKEAVIYHYKHAASGFSAKLTPTQVGDLSKQPGVLQVMKDKTVSLHSGGQAGARVGRLGVM